MRKFVPFAILAFIAVVTLTCLASCGGGGDSDDPPVIKVSSITLTPASSTIEVGKTTTITATVLPTNATDKSLSWSSSDVSIATVDQTGKVTAVKAGTVTITATAKDGSGVKGTCTITVTAVAIKITSITLSPASTTVALGKTPPITAIILPEDATDKSLSWSSSDESIATVDQNGKVTASETKTGNVTITATAKDGSGVKGTCTITVVIKVASISLTPASSTIKVGKTTTITATVLPTNATDKSLSWSSSDESIATVDQTGKVTGVKVGDVTITAAAKDGNYVKGTCTIKIAPPSTGNNEAFEDVTIN